MTTLEIVLSDDVARRAKAAGLLEPKSLEGMFGEQLRQLARDELKATMASVAALAESEAIAAAEVEAELLAMRRERRLGKG